MPEPLSLMPGPSTTESRCAPTTTVSSALPCLVSAIRFLVLASRSASVEVVMCSVTAAGRELLVERLRVGEAEPDDRDGPSGCRACRRTAPSRPAWPSLKMITATRAGGLGVLGLDPEVAGAALDQRDVAGGEAGEVAGLAARVGRAGARPAAGTRCRRPPAPRAVTSPLPEYVERAGLVGPSASARSARARPARARGRTGT